MTEKNQFKPLKGWVGHGGTRTRYLILFMFLILP